MSVVCGNEFVLTDNDNMFNAYNIQMLIIMLIL